MGIDISGGMIVGEDVENIHSDDTFDTLDDFIEYHDMRIMSPWYDAWESDCTVGYTVPDIPVNAQGS